MDSEATLNFHLVLNVDWQKCEFGLQELGHGVRYQKHKVTSCLSAGHPPPSFKAHPGSYSDSHWSYWGTTSTACTPTASTSSCCCCCWNSWPFLRLPKKSQVWGSGKHVGHLMRLNTQCSPQSVGSWVSVLSVGGTGGPGAGAWGHHMQHQHIARLAAPVLPGSPSNSALLLPPSFVVFWLSFLLMWTF